MVRGTGNLRNDIICRFAVHGAQYVGIELCQQDIEKKQKQVQSSSVHGAEGYTNTTHQQQQSVLLTITAARYDTSAAV